jgi:hypothetical protein
MIFNLLTQDGVLQACIWDSGHWILAVSSAVLTKTDDFSHSTHTNADFVPGLDHCHSLLSTLSFITHYSYDAHTYIQHSAHELHSTQTHPVLSISNNNLNFICFSNIQTNTITTGSTYDINHKSKWFHLCQLTVYGIVYQYLWETQWLLWVQPKHVSDFQYVIKYILPKCIHWFTMYYNLMKGMGHIKLILTYDAV